MRINKKFLSFILAFVMVLGLVPSTAFATDLEALLEGTVYISISDDAEYITDPNGNPMAYVAVPMEELLLIDLADYGLENYLYDADDDGIPEITALHLYIYVHEILLGLDWSEVNVSGDPGHTYLAGGLFGFMDENLRYDVNGDYPIDEELTEENGGWLTGATSDRVVLKDGDFLNVAHYGSWAFYSDSATGFQYFADSDGNLRHSYQAIPGEALEMKLVRHNSSWDGLVKDVVIGGNVYYGKTFGEPEGMVYSNEEGMLEITFPTAGTWYVWTYGCYGNENPDDIVSAPAYATVNVPDLRFTLDLTDLTAPVYESGVLNENYELVLEDMATAGEESKFGFSAESYDQYILYVRYFDYVVGWNINGVNYFAEDTGEGYVEWDLGNDVYGGCYFAQEDADGTVYDEFFLQLGLEGAYNTPGSWTVTPLVFTEAIDEVLLAIDDIYIDDDEITLEDGDSIRNAAAVYSVLSQQEKEIFDYLFSDFLELLEIAQETYNNLLNDKTAADEVISLINAIGDVDLTKEEEITAARAAYDALTDTRKAMVSNYDVLTAAEERLQQLQEEAAKAAANQAAADNAESAIEAIGTVTVFSEKKIKTARETYDALTDDQKALVKNLETLTAAENAFE